jgi:hypothetical protein
MHIIEERNTYKGKSGRAFAADCIIRFPAFHLKTEGYTNMMPSGTMNWGQSPCERRLQSLGLIVLTNLAFVQA